MTSEAEISITPYLRGAKVPIFTGLWETRGTELTMIPEIQR